MKHLALPLFLGVLISLPLIYFLELRSEGAITLLIFLCVCLVAIPQFIYTRFKKRGT